MGNSKSKTKGLTKGMPAVVDEGESRLISKKEALTSVETQLTQMKQMIDDLQHQLRKDELAARRFVAIKNNDLATLTLRKRAYHQRLINNLDKRVQRHENLDQQIRQNKVTYRFVIVTKYGIPSFFFPRSTALSPKHCRRHLKQ
eukprot:GHVN01028374.1.p1 GENE.GHVN01028374.1~~GHVN01028374.1.p1  ORF type:complete len:144 (+),score=11.23 GHVN01028374.1:823-1254(+)